MKRQALLDKLEEFLEVGAGTLTGTARLDETEGWDSLAIMGFIALMDEQFGKAPTGTDISACRTVDDLLALAGDDLED